MGIETVSLTKKSSQTAPVLFSYLSEHENMASLFSPAKVERVRDGHPYRNGVGSRRLVKMSPLPAIEETVTAFSENEFLEYRVTNFGPLKNHLGRMEFLQDGEGCTLKYTIRFESRIPLAGPLLREVLAGVIRRNLRSIR